MTQTLALENRGTAMALHISALGGYLFPFGGLIIPLIIWLMKKDESFEIDQVGREVLNFYFTMLIAWIVSLLLCFILIGFILLPALWLYGIIVTIVAAIKANEGMMFRYPMTIRFL